MQHLDGVGKSGDIQHSPFTQHVNTDLPDTGANLVHRPPIRRLLSALNGIKLKANLSARFSRKVTQIIQAGAYESQRFHHD